MVSVEGIARRHPASLDAPRAIASKYEPDPKACEEIAAFMAEQALFEVVPRTAFGLIERPDEFSVRATRWVY